MRTGPTNLADKHRASWHYSPSAGVLPSINVAVEGSGGMPNT